MVGSVSTQHQGCHYFGRIGRLGLALWRLGRQIGLTACALFILFILNAVEQIYSYISLRY